MNNKGFAITTMLYGTFILFLMLMFIMLSLLSSFKTNMEKLIDGNNGARDIVTLKCSDYIEDPDGDGDYTALAGVSLDDTVINKIIGFCGY